ncbi:hypothetical protein F4820DRAFT_438753 [Hypoxylon rubiginosum]|uniref:Uncharacterized protein n=1 Tax=Hypoxylon rubiginosum TaxID=110542 RepID=A0ACB9YK53_9PEZI|nr:hypothetical protein F4820DRAFT_438753 [Hypoxylon rubiginosum]
MNPTRSNTAHPITFVNPTKSKKVHRRALFLLRKWIPKDQDWIPKEITAKHLKVIEIQATCQQDSGI